MSTRASTAYAIDDAAAGLRYAIGRATYAPGTWIYVRVAKRGRVLCACRTAGKVLELSVSREDRMPDAGDLYAVRKGLAQLGADEVEEAKEIPERHTVLLTIHPGQGK